MKLGGSYYVFEGVDGCGKTSQADMLQEALEKKHRIVIRVNEPDEHNPVGQLLRQLLKSGEHQIAHAALFLADRLMLQAEVIAPALQNDRSVISSRSFLSTLVYQQENWPLHDLIDMHRGLPVKPDYMIVLDMDPEEALKRVDDRIGHRECYERLDIQKRNRQRYLELMDDYRLHEMVTKTVALINATGTPEEVHQRITGVIGA
jgi:dTMP kinase